MRVSWRKRSVGGVAKAAGGGRRLVRRREASGVALLCMVDVRSASWRWRRGARDPAGQRDESHRGNGAAGQAAGQVTPHYWWQRQSSSDTSGAPGSPAADAKVVTSEQFSTFWRPVTSTTAWVQNTAALTGTLLEADPPALATGAGCNSITRMGQEP
jgi:hypothetical protein